MQNQLEQLNNLTTLEARDELMKCCGSRRWAEQLVTGRPFASEEELKRQVDSIWWSLSVEDWLEAFRSHPKIGERKPAEAVSAESQKWSEHEQAGVKGTASDILQDLAELNRQYESKFGFIFIVCATGKSAEEMLSLLRERLHNDRETEIQIAAGEQAKITQLRLNKLLNQ